MTLDELRAFFAAPATFMRRPSYTAGLCDCTAEVNALLAEVATRCHHCKRYMPQRLTRAGLCVDHVACADASDRAAHERELLDRIEKLEAEVKDLNHGIECLSDAWAREMRRDGAVNLGTITCYIDALIRPNRKIKK